MRGWVQRLLGGGGGAAGAMRKLSDGRFYFLANPSDDPVQARPANGADGAAGANAGGIWHYALQGYMPAAQQPAAQ